MAGNKLFLLYPHSNFSKVFSHNFVPKSIFHATFHVTFHITRHFFHGSFFEKCVQKCVQLHALDTWNFVSRKGQRWNPWKVMYFSPDLRIFFHATIFEKLGPGMGCRFSLEQLNWQRFSCRPQICSFPTTFRCLDTSVICLSAFKIRNEFFHKVFESCFWLPLILLSYCGKAKWLTLGFNKIAKQPGFEGLDNLQQAKEFQPRIAGSWNSVW